MAARREHTRRWHLGRRVDRLQVRRESAHHAQPLRPLVGLCAAGRRAQAIASSLVTVGAPAACR